MEEKEKAHEANFTIQGTKPPTKERNEIKNAKEEQSKNGKGE